MSESKDTLDEIVDQARGLYSLPVVAMRVLELTNNPSIDNAALKECIENDPALATKILRVVNSSLFGLSRQVRDLNQALALLGTKPLKLLVLGFSLPDRLFADVAGPLLGYYWRRTLTKAIASRELSETVWHQPGDEAFLAGLLGDIGMLVLLQQLGEPYIHFLEKVIEENGDLLAMESAALGFDHAQVSARLLERWGLPVALTQAIAEPKNFQHLQEMPAAHAHMPRVLHLAELLTQLVIDHRINVLPELLEAGAAYHRLNRDHVTTLVESLGEKVEALAEVLSLELPDGHDYRDVLVAAHAQMSELTVSSIRGWCHQQRDENQLCDSLFHEARTLAEAVADLAHASARIESPPQHTLAPTATAVRPAAPSVAIEAKSPLAPAASAAVAQAMSDTVDRVLLARLAVSINNCRQSRSELSLALLEVDHFAELREKRGPQVTRDVVRYLETACRALDHPAMEVIKVGAARFALVLPDCDRRLAVELAGQAVRGLRILAERKLPSGPMPVSISAGVATAAALPKNFEPQALRESSERCLNAALSSGGNAVKSIEIF